MSAGRRSKAAVVAAGALVAAGASLAPAPAVAAASDTPSLQGLVLTGTCPKAPSDLKNVIVSPQARSLWVPLRFTSGETLKPLNRWILPYEVGVAGEGLKTRHLLPGESYVRPLPIKPLKPATCVFEGRTKEDGPFTVEITGTIVGSGALLGW